MVTPIKKVVMGTFVATAAFVFAGCGQDGGHSAPEKTATTERSAATVSLKIVKWGPQTTKQGVAFNEQPNGGAALWIQVDQSLEGSDSVVVMDGANLTSAISGNLITADVPADFYAKTGVHPVHVALRKGSVGALSNDVEFIVQ